MTATTTDEAFTRTSRVIEDGDDTLHYHEAGSGPPLLLLHGSGPGVSAWSNFAANLTPLAEHFRVIALDMPGFGRSALPALDRAYPHIAADAVVRLLDRLGIERVDLLGNSFGGYVALQSALHAPERVGRLVLFGPGGLSVPTLAPDPSEGARRLGEFMMAPSRGAMEAWIDTMVANRAMVDEALIDDRMEMALRPSAIPNALAIFASLAAHPDPVPLWARLDQVKAPALVLWGRDDRMMPLEGGLFGFRRLRRAELHVFSNCGHWVQVERKAEFERLVIEFLTRPAR
ncbi:alpha/beta fold hydrolase [Acidiferrimicrobium sp. IK]|uniref:alpha/beta fold hydrolase n=1 Tax=Acidiferrimicrobium sp. IK TaxID=2871700 RepID=UPI0021CB0C99|nr:alpha/beta fold hydrolase [Acidiferrimicrobium sp. IK]MCU4184193.1 alpha/beta fold hydrolase [Acidiferrimicrobium sp. IK]